MIGNSAKAEPDAKDGRSDPIINVWEDNFEQEMENMTRLLDTYTCVTIV